MISPSASAWSLITVSGCSGVESSIVTGPAENETGVTSSNGRFSIGPWSTRLPDTELPGEIVPLVVVKTGPFQM